MGAISIECGSAGAMVWEALNTIAVLANATTNYFEEIVWRPLCTRISTPVTVGTVTVVTVRSEERRGVNAKAGGPLFLPSIPQGSGLTGR
jgi:hypothetical protein